MVLAAIKRLYAPLGGGGLGHQAAPAGCLGVLAPGCVVGLLGVVAIDAKYALIMGIIRRTPFVGYPAGGGCGCFRGTDIACCGAAVAEAGGCSSAGVRFAPCGR